MQVAFALFFNVDAASGGEDTGNCTVVTLGDIEKQRWAEIHKQQSGAGVGVVR